MSQVAAVHEGSVAIPAAHHGHVEYQSPLGVNWGKLMMWLFLISDAMTFAGLLVAYGALRFASPDWPLPWKELDIPLTAFNTFLLICSSVTMVKALSAIKRGDQRGLKLGLLGTIVGGIGFLSIQAYEWTHLISHGWGLHSHLFNVTFFCLTGFHGAHVTGGVIFLTTVLIKAMRGRYTATDHNRVEAVGLYWHFVDLIWILVFTFVYLI